MRPFPLENKKLMFMFMIMPMLMILMLLVGTKLKCTYIRVRVFPEFSSGQPKHSRQDSNKLIGW